MTSKLCKICGYKPIANAPSRLEDHIKSVHEKIKRYYCDQCDYACYHKHNIKKHEKTHQINPSEKDKKTEILCKICGYKANIPSRLEDHIKSVHQNVKRFYCDQCDYACYYKQNIQKHKKIHQDNPTAKKRKFGNVCNICDKKFKNPTYVQEHIEAVHENIKRFHCNVCEFASYNEFQLTLCFL